MHVPVRDPARREVDAVAAQDPLARLGLALELPDDRRPVDARGSEVRLVALEVVDDPASRLGLHSAGMLREDEAQWKYWPPSMTIVWPVMKSAAGVQRKTTAPTTSSGTWSRWIVRDATETSRSFSTTSGCDFTPSDIVKPGATQFTWIESLAELLRERARERDDRALRRHVVQEERDAAKRRSRRDVHDLPAALLAHHRDHRAAGEEHRRDVHLHHAVPLLERDLGERAHLERRVETGVVDEHVDAAVALERLLDHRGHVLLRRDVRTDAAFGRVQVGDDDRRALRLEPRHDRSADPLRAARDDRDLAVERAHCEAARTTSGRGSGSAACG